MEQFREQLIAGFKDAFLKKLAAEKIAKQIVARQK